MKTSDIIKGLKDGQYEGFFDLLYGNRAKFQRERYLKLAADFLESFGEGEDVYIFSSPGRAEIGGNHTDHNGGYVLAASVNLDIIAMVRKNNSGIINLLSPGHKPNHVKLDRLTPLDGEDNHSNSLIRGINARFSQLGYNIGGFDACTSSEVSSGSGLSSSAAFEILLCQIISSLFGTPLCPSDMALISKYAENVFFKKPCGLMDQMACSYGSFICIDFEDKDMPKVEKLDFNLPDYILNVVNTGGSHSGLISEYAAIPEEMFSVAEYFGKTRLRDVNKEDFYAEFNRLRKRLSDRAILRAAHFFEENERAYVQASALKEGDIGLFLSLMSESGKSSFMYLQNIFSAAYPHIQGISLALHEAERILGRQGGYRIHGGGFAGTILAFVPKDLQDRFSGRMTDIFGQNSVWRLSVRREGPIEVKNEALGI